MSFNTDPSKEAQKVVFQRRLQKRIIIPYISNNMPLTQTIVQNHIEMYLDEKINCNTHIKEKLSKVYKDTGLFRGLSNKLPRQAFFTMYKAFARPHIGYGVIVYDKPNNETFINKFEKTQYDPTL